MTYDLATLTRPERVRNIVDPPMMPDEFLHETKQERRRRQMREAARRRARARAVQIIY
jgi:hypothetical protein